MRNIGFLLLSLALVGCEDIRIDPTPPLSEQNAPQPPTEMNTRGTPGRIHVESEQPSTPTVTPSGPAVAAPKEVTVTAYFHDDVVFDDGSSSGTMEFKGTAVHLDVQPLFDVSGDLYQGSYTIVEPDPGGCYFDYGQNVQISMNDDTVTWHMSTYGFNESCREWGEKAMDGGMRIEASYYTAAGGSVETLILEIVP